MPQCQIKDTNEKSILINATLNWFVNSAMNQDQFAVKLGEALEAAGFCDVPTEGEQHIRWLMSQKKKVYRIFREDGYFPLEWKAVWLSLLPEPYKSTAMAELLALMGMMPIPLPVTLKKENVTQTKANLDAVTLSFSQLMTRLNPALDGFYDTGDCKHELQELSDSYMQLATQCMKEMKSIEVIGIKPRVVQMFEQSPLFAALFKKGE